MMNRMACATLLFFSTHTAGAVDLFNGRDFGGWELKTSPAAGVDSVFRMLPGGVVASTGQPSGFLATRDIYRNYKLHVEWRWSGKPGNGGILLHISDGPMDRVWPLSLQVQTKRGNAGDLLPMAGASFAEPLTSAHGAEPRIKGHTAPDSELAAGEWNVCDIVSRDGKVDVTINGVVQNSVTRSEPASGRIGFQLEGAPYELRRVALVELD
ncbi:protein of unknown function [Duganella sp. CF517]|uniref:3-keto-disaccharide hydrolase n=1 Tax=Duganella sp. CF517 TaxID=1881038 RepID=UPI0008D7D5AF|nr:DUF1080 domain-containing protein [Duganella sp. CF517]SEN83286.1 protein of unknown function [Duganella sp. CF517]